MEPIDARNVRLKWDQAVDPDVLHGGRVYVRHSSLTDGTGTFNNAIDLVEALPGNSTEQIVPSLEGEYILRFQDDQGNFSTGSASVLVDLPDILDEQIILSTASRQDLLSTPFSGAKRRTAINSGALELEETTGVTEGTYDFADFVDLGRVYSLDLKRFIRSIGFLVQESTKISGLTLTNNSTTARTIQGQVIPALTIRITTQGNLAHGYSVGDAIQYTSATNFGNGTYTITNIISTTVFEFQIPSIVSGRPQTLFNTNNFYRKLTLLDQLIPAGSFWDDYATDGNFDGVSADTVNCKMLTAQSDTDPTQLNNGTFQHGTSFTCVQHGRDADGQPDTSIAGTVVTVTATGHGLSVGNNIRLAGSDLITSSLTIGLGFHLVEKVIDANTFTLVASTSQLVTSAVSGTYIKFTNFVALSNGTFKGRTFAFRLQLTTGKPLVENIRIQQAGVIASFPSRTENSYQTGNSPPNDISMAAQNSISLIKTVTFARPFFTGTTSLGGANSFKPNVGVTVQNLGSGEYVSITDITGESFKIHIKDSSNNPVTKAFTFTAVGYGKGV